MQPLSITFLNNAYHGIMDTGRPSKRPRPAFGERLHVAREAVGLSQAQVAEKLRISQAGYSSWERDPVALHPEQIVTVAQILRVSVDELLGVDQPKIKSGGPVGKLRRVFEEACRLPRHQQGKVAEFVEGFLTLHRNNGHKQAA